MSALVTNIRNFNFKVMKNGIAWLEREIKCLGREEKKNCSKLEILARENADSRSDLH